jgi:hypothetical protein
MGTEYYLVDLAARRVLHISKLYGVADAIYPEPDDPNYSPRPVVTHEALARGIASDPRAIGRGVDILSWFDSCEGREVVLMHEDLDELFLDDERGLRAGWQGWTTWCDRWGEMERWTSPA